jgi:hypothetical protein
MSKYMINKLMRAIEMSDEQVALYKHDPPAYIRSWLETVGTPDAVTDDRALTAAESEAFGARDYGRLYELGAHPYLLWHFIEAVYTPEVPWPTLNESYREAVRPHGYPDYVI